MFIHGSAPEFIKRGESILPGYFPQIIPLLQYKPQSQGPIYFLHTSIVNTMIYYHISISIWVGTQIYLPYLIVILAPYYPLLW